MNPLPRDLSKEPRPKRQTGFTLVELLVVVAILALLMSLLMPALTGAIEQTRLVTCRMNMRNLALAVNIYVDDHYGRYVPSQSDRLNMIKTNGWQANSLRFGWAGYLAKEKTIEEMEMLICPGAQPKTDAHRFEKMYRKLREPVSRWLYDTTYPSGYTYMWGHYSLHTSSGDFYIKDWKFEAIFPRRQIMMAEAVNAFGPPQDTGNQSCTYHGGAFDSQMNIAFSDGSIEVLRNWSDPGEWNWFNTYYYPHNDRYSWAFWRVFKHGPSEAAR